MTGSIKLFCSFCDTGYGDYPAGPSTHICTECLRGSLGLSIEEFGLWKERQQGMHAEILVAAAAKREKVKETKAEAKAQAFVNSLTEDERRRERRASASND